MINLNQLIDLRSIPVQAIGMPDIDTNTSRSEEWVFSDFRAPKKSCKWKRRQIFYCLEYPRDSRELRYNCQITHICIMEEAELLWEIWLGGFVAEIVFVCVVGMMSVLVRFFVLNYLYFKAEIFVFQKNFDFLKKHGMKLRCSLNYLFFLSNAHWYSIMFSFHFRKVDRILKGKHFHCFTGH